MDTTLAMQGIGLLFERDRAPAFLASRPRKSARELSGSTDDVFKGMSLALEHLLSGVIQKRTAAEFTAAYADAFPKYVDVILALSRFADAVVPPDVIQRLQWESFCEIEGDFREHGLAAFGRAVQDQALFTVWTLRKINDLLAQIHGAKTVEPASADEDKTYSVSYMVNTLRANFSLDCLNVGLREKSAIYPEVLEELTNGLRAVVNAYAWIRRGVDLRIPRAEPALEKVQWDDEDQELLDEATRDVLGEPV
jgi:hypothetical protein